MHLPLLIVPPGGIKVVASLRLASHLFAPYETAWAWGAKLAAANALSAFEVAALMGVSSMSARPLLPAAVPRAAQALGRELEFPSGQIEHAFLGGRLKSLHPFMCEQLRLCPACARLGYHFIIHQMRSFACCPLHHLPLRERCPRCAERLVYDFGQSKAHGPISCPTCGAPQLPVSRGGYPKTGAMSDNAFRHIARWLAFLQRRTAHPVLRENGGVIDAGQHELASRIERIPVLVPAKSARNPTVSSLRGRWSADAEYRRLEIRYWQHANALWRQCQEPSRRWYRRLLKGHAVEPAPTPHILAFIYWRMTWQGCSNPYLLRRGHGLPLYGVAEWEAGQPAPDEGDIEDELCAFAKALEGSWNDWLDCIDLLGVKELERHAWRLRAYPGAYIPLPHGKQKRRINNFTQLLRKNA